MMSLTFGLFTQVSGSGPLGPLVQMMSLTFGLFTQVSGSGPLGPLVYVMVKALSVSYPVHGQVFFFILTVCLKILTKVTNNSRTVAEFCDA